MIGLILAVALQAGSVDDIAETSLDFAYCAVAAAEYTAKMPGSLQEAADAALLVCNREQGAVRNSLNRAGLSSADTNSEMQIHKDLARNIATLYIVRDRSCGEDVACMAYFRARGTSRR